MMERLQSVGISSTPIIGNLNKTGESYMEIDHVWLLVNVHGFEIAFDHGVCYLDPQHREGFLISKQELLVFVEQDSNPNMPIMVNPVRH